MITIPNKLVWGSAIINATRRVDVSVGVSYSGNLEKAIKVAMDLMKGHALVMAAELGDSSVNLQLRAWVKTADYWTFNGDLTNIIFNAYKKVLKFHIHMST